MVVSPPSSQLSAETTVNGCWFTARSGVQVIHSPAPILTMHVCVYVNMDTLLPVCVCVFECVRACECVCIQSVSPLPPVADFDQ